MFGTDVYAQPHDVQHWIADSGNSTQVGTQVKIERFTSTDAKNIKAAGFSFVRFGVWVNSMQAAGYQSADLPVLLTVRSTTPLAQSSSDESHRNSQLRDAAEQLVHGVRVLVHAYGSHVLAIELWNEPELPTYWPTGDVDATFPLYMRTVCLGLETIRRSIPVVGFGFATAPAPGSRSDKLLQSLGRPSYHCIDAISYHAYGMSERQIENVSSYIHSRYGLPALITEWGVSSGSQRGINGPAADIKSFLMKRNSMRTPLISIYEWQDTANSKNARERNFGLVDAAGTGKPALDAAVAALRK
jgi:hypothetical protein